MLYFHPLTCPMLHWNHLAKVSYNLLMTTPVNTPIPHGTGPRCQLRPGLLASLALVAKLSSLASFLYHPFSSASFLTPSPSSNLLASHPNPPSLGDLAYPVTTWRVDDPYFGLNCIHSTFIYQNPNPQDLVIGLYLETGTLKKQLRLNEVIGWVPVQHD